MFVDINRFKDDTTVKQLKEFLQQEKNKQNEEQNKHIEFLRSYEGKYIFCKHNQNTGFVCHLLKDWWLISHPVYYITNSKLLKENTPINHLWLKSSQTNSIDLIREITKEQYEEVEQQYLSIENTAKYIHTYLWNL